MVHKNISPDNYLTVKESAQLVGKSEHTIRKLIRKKKIPYSKVKTSRGYQIRINKSGLKSYYEMINTKFSTSINTNIKDGIKISHEKISTKAKSNVSTGINNTSSIGTKYGANSIQILVENLQCTVEFLKEQLQIKDKQIEELNNTIDQLIERNRETNILLKNFQDKTLLLESSGQKEMQPQKIVSKPKEKKKDFFSLLFGR